MAENETGSTKTNPDDTAHEEDDEKLLSDQRPLAGQPDDFVTIILRKETAVDLLNALVTSLGTVPEPGGDNAGVFEQAGDNTTGSDR